MGLLIDGRWHDQGYDTGKSGGRFVRKDSQFRNWATSDGRPGPTGAGGFKAEAGRYHLYVSLACPWAHRTLIFRKLKGLEPVISLSVVHWLMGSDGWTFEEGEGVIPDTVNGARYLHEVYTRALPSYSGRVTVPVLFDKKEGTIVNNESSEIIRMLNTEFNAIILEDNAKLDLYPAHLRKEIDGVNEWVYDRINSASAFLPAVYFHIELDLAVRADGVYKSGFAKTPEAYQAAVVQLFEALDRAEALLKDKTYLVGDRLTEADIRLFVTIVSSGSPCASGTCIKY